MRRAIACSLLLACLAGCPGEKTTETPPSPPTGDPSAAATGDGAASDAGPADAGAAGGEAAPAQADVGPRLKFDVRPDKTLEQANVAVTLKRIAILPRTAENLAREPIEVEGEEPGDGSYLSLTLAVTVDGEPHEEIEQGKGVARIGPFVIGYGDQDYVFQSGLFLPLEGQPGTVYHYRQVIPPPITATKMDVVVGLMLEGQDEALMFEFNRLPAHGGAARPKTASEEESGDEPQGEAGGEGEE